jgi:hypothetical protein
VSFVNDVAVFERLQKLNTGVKMEYFRDAAAMVSYELTKAKVPVSDETILVALENFKRRNGRCFWTETQMAFLAECEAPQELRPIPRRKPKNNHPFRPIPGVLLPW